MSRTALAVVAHILLFIQFAPAGTTVTVRRIPGGGVQPQVVVDGRGIAHLIYLKGDPARADIIYQHSPDGGATWSAPIRVNSDPGSAVAIGTVRGAHIALGRNVRVHVAWMGSTAATPKLPGGSAPMLYARLADDRATFEPQRNLIVNHPGLDGGGSVAADVDGNVFVAWHAPQTPGSGEQSRRVWVARSADDGKTFAAEIAVTDPTTGACGCCGMRVAAYPGRLFVLYRGASEMVNRGMYLADVPAGLSGARERQIAPMKVGMCIMSTAALTPAAGNILAAWETQGIVSWGTFDPARPDGISVHTLPPTAGGQKHPALAVNKSAEVLLAYASGTGWNKGGRVVWQLFDPAGNALPDRTGVADGLPAWDCPAAFQTPDGGFVILY